MKNVFKIALPFLAFALASAGAITTNHAKETRTGSTLIPAYVQNGSSTNCDLVNVNCSQTNTNQFCMTGTPSKRAWLKDDVTHDCTVILYKIL